MEKQEAGTEMHEEHSTYTTTSDRSNGSAKGFNAWFVWTVGILLVLAMFLLGYTINGIADMRERNSNLDKRVALLEDRYARIQSDLCELKADGKNTQKMVDDIRRAVK